VGLTRRERAALVHGAAAPPSAPQVASAVHSARVLETVTLAPLPDPTASAEPPTVSVTDLPSVVLRPVVVPVAAPAPSASAALVPVVDPDGILSVPPAPAASKAVAPVGTSTIRTHVVNCSPPYYFDEVGLKIFKPECVN